MNDKNYEILYYSLKRLHESANTSIEELNTRINVLQSELALRDEKLINCQRALDINKDIMRNALLEQNRMQEDYGNEIQKLKAELKALQT